MDVSLLRRLRAIALLMARELDEATEGSAALRQSVLQRKTIHELSHDQVPTPDGLSDAYIALAAACNQRIRQNRQQGGAPSTAASIVLDICHEEIAAALLLERRLLHAAGC